MLRIALVLLVIALLAGMLGFFNISGLAWDGFKIVALIFLVLAFLAFIGGALTPSPPP